MRGKFLRAAGGEEALLSRRAAEVVFAEIVRELVRRTAENNRIIVGIVDDDILLRGHYIEMKRIEGIAYELGYSGATERPMYTSGPLR